MKLKVGLDEIIPTKTAVRELPQAIDRLERGDAEQFVITRRNVPRAVLITVERYEQLLSAANSPRNVFSCAEATAPQLVGSGFSPMVLPA